MSVQPEYEHVHDIGDPVVYKGALYLVIGMELRRSDVVRYLLAQNGTRVYAFEDEVRKVSA